MIKKFNHELETIFFESAIVDIDFSNWSKFVFLVIISRWTEFNDSIFPDEKIVFLKLKNISSFSMNKAPTKNEECSEKSLPGIEVNFAEVELKNKINIDSSDLKVKISFENYEISYPDQGVLKFIKNIQINSASIIRPDINYIYEFVNKRKPS